MTDSWIENRNFTMFYFFSLSYILYSIFEANFVKFNWYLLWFQFNLFNFSIFCLILSLFIIFLYNLSKTYLILLNWADFIDVMFFKDNVDFGEATTFEGIVIFQHCSYHLTCWRISFSGFCCEVGLYFSQSLCMLYITAHTIKAMVIARIF